MKQDWEIYRDTGILGAYRPEQIILRRSEDGGVETLFRDSTAKWEGDDLTDRKSTRLNSSHRSLSRMPSSA